MSMERDLKRMHIKLAQVCHALNHDNVEVHWTTGYSLGRPFQHHLRWVEDLIMEAALIADKYGDPIDDGVLEAASPIGKSSPPSEGELWAMRAARAALEV